MLDLGTGFVASVARDPDALAIVDESVRLTYAQWYARISSLVASLDRIGLKARRSSGHRAAELRGGRHAALGLSAGGHRHHAGQLARQGRRTRLLHRKFRGRAVVYQDVSAQAVEESKRAPALPRICGWRRAAGAFSFDRMVAEPAAEATPRVGAEAWSVMLYTSGTTSRPKGVPRRHRAERAAGIAHVAQNLYRRGERTLGVMPLYHTMGVRSLIAMSLIGGTFVCLPRYDAGQALALIEAEKITNLYLVPTLYHDLVHAREFASTDVSQRPQTRLCRRLDDRRAAEETERRVPARAVRQPLRQFGNLHLHDRPERARQARIGRQGRNQSANTGSSG